MLVTPLLSIVGDSQHGEATGLIHAPTPCSRAETGEAPLAGGASPGSDYSIRCQTLLAKKKVKSETLTALHARLPSCADHRAVHVGGAQRPD